MASAQAFRRFPHEKIIKKCPPGELSTSGFWTMHNFCCERKHCFRENTLRGWNSKTHFYGFQMLPKRETWIVLVGKNSGKSVFHEKCVVLHFRNITYRSKSSHLFSRIQIFCENETFQKSACWAVPESSKNHVYPDHLWQTLPDDQKKGHQQSYNQKIQYLPSLLGLTLQVCW